MRVRIPLTYIAAFALPFIASCGGGGESPAPSPVPPPAPTTFAIGGSATGVVGSFTLQNNSGDSIEVAANGAFSFPTRVAQGGAYAVTVSRQPSGPDCSVTSGAGIAAADVTTVRVTCTVDPATRYVVLRAQEETTFRSRGLYVLSNKQTDRPPVRITSEEAEVVALVAEHTLDARGAITGSRPGSVVYRTVGSTGGDTLWSLDLTGASTLVPRRLGNLVLGTPDMASAARPWLCDAVTILRDLRSAASAFLVLSLLEDPQQGCLQSDGRVGTRQVIVTLGDTPGAAPRPIAHLRAERVQFAPVYRADGTLNGLFVPNTLASTLEFFRDETFTNPATVLGDIAGVDVLHSGPTLAPQWTNRGGDQTSAVLVIGTSNGADIYRADGSGAVTRLYDITGIVEYPFYLGDDVYVLDRDFQVSPTPIVLVRIPLATSQAAIRLWSYQSPDPPCYGHTPAALLGDRLLLSRNCLGWPLQALPPSADLVTVSRTAAGNAAPFAQYTGTNVKGIEVVGERVLMQLVDDITITAPGDFLYRTEVRASAGAVLQPQAPGAFPASTPGAAGPTLQIRGIPGRGQGGGELSGLTLPGGGSLGTTPIRTADGAAYVLPAGADSSSLVAIGRNAFYGSVWRQAGPEVTLAVDVSRNLVTLPSVPGIVLPLVTFEP